MYKKTKISPKNQFRHYLSDLLTNLNVEMGGDNSVEAITMLISNEDLFLGEKSELFTQEFKIDEIVEITCSVLNDKIERRGVKLKLFNSDSSIETDRHFFSNALKYLIEVLIGYVSFLEFEFDEQSGVLIIIHDGKDCIDQYLGDSSVILLDCLKDELLPNKKLSFNLSMTILDILEMGVDFSENRVMIGV